MTGVEFARRFRTIFTRTSTVSVSDTMLADMANLAKDEVVQEAEQIDEGYFSRPQVRDIVAGQRTYPLPVEYMGRIEKVSVKLAGWEDYREITEVSLTGVRLPTDEESIVAHYQNTSPRYMLRRGSIILLTGSAIEDAPQGLSVWAKVYPPDFTATTFTFNGDLSNAPTDTTVGIPRPLHLPILLRASIIWKENQRIPVPLTQQEENWKVLLAEAIGHLSNQNIVRDVSPQFSHFSEETGFTTPPNSYTSFNPLS